MSESQDLFSYPPIDPVNFDLIIVGTGLSESVIAAAASAAGKTILHLDPNSFYGSHFASLSFLDLTSYLTSHNPLPAAVTTTDSEDVVVDLLHQPLCSDAEIASYDEYSFLCENSRKFNIDLGGPRALFSADQTIDLLLKSGAAQYLEFKGIDECFVYEAHEGLANVPDSRGAIFRDKKLSLKEKNQLMRFFKLVQQHLDDTQEEKISEEDMEIPFVSFLEKMKLPPKIKSILLYAIAMVDYDQDSNEVCKDLLKTKDGINCLAQYSSSVGRFPNAPGALLYPIYGEGELPQAFCRRAAVKGCIYVLRMPVVSLLMDKVTGLYKGVRLASGQDLYSQQLILDPSFSVPSPLSLSPRDFPCERLQMLSQRDIKGIVARGICITRSSIKPGVSNCSVVYPPRSLYPEQMTSIKSLQIGSNLAVCPEGTFILYFSALCNNSDEGKNLLKAAINALLTLPVSGNTESISSVQSDSEDAKLIVLWSALYTQKLIMSKFELISSTSTPDANLNYNDLLDAAEKSFGIGWIVGSTPLFWAFSIHFMPGTAYSIDLPLLRWKRIAALAAMCIVVVQGIVFQLAFFLHTQTYVFKRPIMLPRSLIFATAFMSFFCLVLALFKDIPDNEGDEKFGIQSLSLHLGQKRVFWICVSLLEMIYGVAILVGATSSSLWSKMITVLAHALLASILWYHAKSVDLKCNSAIESFYMFIWKLFYIEYFIIPLFR